MYQQTSHIILDKVKMNDNSVLALHRFKEGMTVKVSLETLLENTSDGADETAQCSTGKCTFDKTYNDYKTDSWSYRFRKDPSLCTASENRPVKCHQKPRKTPTNGQKRTVCNYGNQDQLHRISLNRLSACYVQYSEFHIN